MAVTNITDPVGTITQRVWKSSLRKFLQQQGYTHTLHLAFNRTRTIHGAKQDLKALHKDVGEILLGKLYKSLPRIPAVFFIEHADSNLHVHSLWRIDPRHTRTFVRMFRRVNAHVWTNIVTSGTCDLDMIGSAMYPSISYTTKDQNINSPAETMLFAEDL